jgi:hypothetical protein
MNGGDLPDTGTILVVFRYDKDDISLMALERTTRLAFERLGGVQITHLKASEGDMKQTFGVEKV